MSATLRASLVLRPEFVDEVRSRCFGASENSHIVTLEIGELTIQGELGDMLAFLATARQRAEDAHTAWLAACVDGADSESAIGVAGD